MKLIYIYGPPAVGKLSVGKELAKLTKFKLFHAHLTADYVSSIFPLRDDITNDLKCKIAYIMFEEASKHDINIIFTKVYYPNDKNFVKKVIQIIEKYNGEVLFIKLYCKPEKLYKRVTQNSRKAFDKVKKINHLKKILKKDNHFETIPFKKSLIINNDNILPKECAKKIKEYYNLN